MEEKSFFVNTSNHNLLWLVITALIIGSFCFLNLPQKAYGVKNCGGEVDNCICGKGNPYICSENECGNCTWWAWHKACCEWHMALPPGPLEWGNAINWWEKARNGGYLTGTNPMENCIFVANWWGKIENPSIKCSPGEADCQNWGHVGWVTQVHEDDSFDTSEMSWGGWAGGACGVKNFTGNTRSVLKSTGTSVIGFIYSYSQYFKEASERYKIPSNLLFAIAIVESKVNQEAKNPIDGGCGIMQLTGETRKEAARLLGVTEQSLCEVTPEGARLNILGGAAILDSFKCQASPRVWSDDDFNKCYQDLAPFVLTDDEKQKLSETLESWWWPITRYNGAGLDGLLQTTNYPFHVWDRLKNNLGLNISYAPLSYMRYLLSQERTPDSKTVLYSDNEIGLDDDKLYPTPGQLGRGNMSGGIRWVKPDFNPFTEITLHRNDGSVFKPAQGVDVVLVIDRSGSMDGEPIDKAREAASLFVDLMNVGDQVGVVSFSDSSRIDFPLTPITSTTGAVVFSDDMEKGTGNWGWNSPWAQITSNCHSPNTCWTDSPGGNYSNNADVSLYSPTINLSLGTTTIFLDNMEGGAGSWTADSPWAKITSDYHSPTTSWTDSPGGNYSNNANVSLHSPTIDLSSVSNPVLKFWTKYSLESGYDYGRVLITTDNGATWNKLVEYTGDQSSWVQKVIDLSGYKGYSSIKIAFQLVSDYSVTYDGWYIDDVEIMDRKAPVVLKFWTKYSLESGYDYGRVLITTDNGATWNKLAEYTGTQSSWVEKIIDLSAFIGESVQIVFQLKTDSSVTYDGWYIDDVMVTKGNVKDSAKNAISNIYAEGGTSIGAGLIDAKNELTSKGREKRAIVLLSDGGENTSPWVKDVLPSIIGTKTPIYTIGLLGFELDESLLINIASTTGGSYYRTPSPADLLPIYEKIRSAVGGLHGVDSINTNIAQGETKNFSAVIDSSISSAVFTATIAGSDIDLILVKPDGTLIDPSVVVVDPNITFMSGANYKSYTVLSPTPGTWQMRVIGVDIAPQGEMITISVSASTDLTLSLDFNKIEYIPNEPIFAIAELKDSSGPILGTSVVATIETPSGTIDTLTLYDDGAHQDGAANDGIYANSYTNTSERGGYTFKVDTSGISNAGESFTRTITKSTVVGRDSDGDGMPDAWEDIFGLDKYRDDSGEDPDNDGLTNLQEYLHRTNPKNPDTDGDGYNDGEEVQAGSNPLDPNSVPDSIAPSLPIGIISIPNIWTNVNSFGLGWTNPYDPSGIAAAWYKVGSPPTSSADGVRVSRNNIQSLSGLGVPAEGEIPVYVWLEDRAGNKDYNNCGQAILKYDSIPPLNPIGFTSIPNKETWTNDNTIDISWTGASDTGSGINGYSYVWDHSPTTIPGTIVQTAETGTRSPPLTDDNNWYFHIRTRDNAGNWATDAAHYGPFYIDRSSPTSGTITINNDALTTTSLTVNLYKLGAIDLSGLSQMRFSNSPLGPWSPSELYSPAKANWDLSNTTYGGNSNPGIKSVYVQFKDNTQNEWSNTFSYQICYQTVQPFPFSDDFSNEKGWCVYEPGGWERGPAVAGGGENGNPDPEMDYSPSDDNYILGFAIGADYPNDMEEKAIISPPVDCSGQDKVFLKFRRYLNVESSEFDKARIYVSNERGNWGEPVWENPPIDLMDNQWTPVVLDISSIAANQGTVYIRFTMGPTNSSRRFSGWIIDDFEVTSEAIFPSEGTYGTELVISGSGFGLKKGKVSIGSTALKVLEWNNEFIQALLTKPIDPAVYDVTIQPSEPKGTLPIIKEDAFVVKPAEIHSIEQDSGTAYDQVTIDGKFFGTKKGAVYLEYEEGGSPIRKSCKVLSWTMDPTTGDSKIVFVVPKMLPEVCDVVVDPYGTIPDAEDEEEDGFTVKAPEIESVNPNSGSVGEQITISGNFFGSKKPKVYLGYVSNGKPTKKSCSVVSWSDDEIIFTVPKLPVGTYDVIVTNSVGLDSLVSGFIIK